MKRARMEQLSDECLAWRLAGIKRAIFNADRILSNTYGMEKCHGVCKDWLFGLQERLRRYRREDRQLRNCLELRGYTLTRWYG